MVNKVIKIYENKEDVYLITYVSDITCEKDPRDAMLVLPGGAYEGCCVDREGEPIALAFLAKGAQCFVLNYSVKENAKYPTPLVDAALAMKYIKEHAKEYNINPDRVFVTGFSAGGHLAAALGSFWDEDVIYENCDMPKGMAKPAGAILGYPVISSGRFAHVGSFQNLLGKKDPSQEELDRYSVEKHVTAKTVPTFLWHTATDEGVPCENSLMMAMALSAAKIPFELHIFPQGCHGLALANHVTSFHNPNMEYQNVEKWVDMAYEWLRNIK